MQKKLWMDFRVIAICVATVLSILISSLVVYLFDVNDSGLHVVMVAFLASTFSVSIFSYFTDNKKKMTKTK
jgi:ABC-type transport system involved in cytochrome c biogenesis permease component